MASKTKSSKVKKPVTAKAPKSPKAAKKVEAKKAAPKSVAKVIAKAVSKVTTKVVAKVAAKVAPKEVAAEKVAPEKGVTEKVSKAKKEAAAPGVKPLSKKEIKAIWKVLHERGREKGFLTYDEINKTLPAQMIAGTLA